MHPDLVAVAACQSDAVETNARKVAIGAMVTAQRKRWRFSRSTIRQNVLGYLWISPWLVGFVIFIFGPMLASVGFSFTNYRIINESRWIGLQNYTYAFVEDDLFGLRCARPSTLCL